ncbi:hypothetical protein JCM19274_4215 [Algibacter lectus]|uniref:Uncharacterized protein n=1 Tax=Algibacter lectus TaxID=221126 RepID=A0A090WPU0_9FLAO|nr:hypothetical protein JCM19274_4215 [Algibacter lectus]
MKIKNTKLQGFKSLIVLAILCISVSSFSQEKYGPYRNVLIMH